MLFTGERFVLFDKTHNLTIINEMTMPNIAILSSISNY